ncbi:hypothetical protein MKX01_035144 [Papaver californicum]|nr:hypothetical protein MKX01_035144 [Papaver californicum]
MWETFSASDPKFAELALHLGGARVLRKDPFECLIQVLCSSNNNIGRITKMVDFVSSLGKYLGTVEGFKFYEFPSRMSFELRGLDTEHVVLMKSIDISPDCENLEGYGRDCNSLPHTGACRSRLTPKLCNRVAEAFVSKYGKYAGWAQTLLLIAELPSQKALLHTDVGNVRVIKPALAVAQDQVNP